MDAKSIRKELKMKKNISVDAIESTLTISKAFYKKASVFGTPEYKELRQAISECPSFTILFKTSDKKTYNGLSFERMEDYIKTQKNSEKYLVEFASVQKVAKAKGSLYPLTKKWFLETYPEYKENSVAAAEIGNNAAANLKVAV